MKHVTEKEIISAVPIAPVMTRREKLEHWADLIGQQHDHVNLLHNLEKWDDDQLNSELGILYFMIPTAFQIGAEDPVFKAMGLIDTVASAMNFFEISQHDLHEFSCDCGGKISNRKMAARVRYFANPTWRNWLFR